MASLDLISPREFVRVAHAELKSNFLECVDAINAGTIFLVYGNSRLEEIYQESIKLKYKANDRKQFRENPEDLYKTQNVQRALFSDLTNEAQIFVDSYVRLRRTFGQGAFVGPHIDFYEDLPRDGINCWISFSSLEAEEAIQFLPARYYTDGDMSGHFKAEVHLDRFGKLMPSSKLVSDAMSHAIKPCEYFVFNSGRTVHCSPFYVKTDRITCDQRAFLIQDRRDVNFGELFNFYSVEDQSRFDGTSNVSTVLSDLWSTYLSNFSFPICQYRSDLKGAPDSPLDIARKRNLDPSLFLRETLGQKVSLDHPLIQDWLASRPRSVGLRMRLLNHVSDPKHIALLCNDLLSLVPENPEKVYRKVFSHPNFSIRSIFSMDRPLERAGSVASLGYLIRFVNLNFWRHFADSLRSRLTKKLAYSLAKIQHPGIFL
jgi:hypothetical protein